MISFGTSSRSALLRSGMMTRLIPARCAARIGDRKGAEGYLQRALNVSPGNPNAYYLMANLAYKAGELELARSRMRNVMAFPVPSAEALLLGACVEKKLGDKPAEASYTYQLKQRYPNASETKLADAGSCP